MMKLIKVILALYMAILIQGCTGEGAAVGGLPDDGSSGSSQTITSPETLSEATTFDNGGRVTGNAPIPTGASLGAMVGPAEMALTINSVVELFYETPLPDANSKIGAVFLQINGANEHFVILPDETGPRASVPRYIAHADLGNGRSVEIAYREDCVDMAPPCEGITIRSQPLDTNNLTTVVTTTAQLSAAIVDDTEDPLLVDFNFGSIPESNWTQPLEITVRATPTGTGTLQFTLIWDAEVDLDLHVFEPSGAEIYWANTTSARGFLDVDDIDGFGPENVFYQNGHDAGTYRAEVDFFPPSGPTSNYVVTITDNGSTTSYSGTIAQGDPDDVVATIDSDGAPAPRSTAVSTVARQDISGFDFCYDRQSIASCDALLTDGGVSMTRFSAGGNCSELGYAGSSIAAPDVNTGGAIGSCEASY